jgi:hypothetical protein
MNRFLLCLSLFFSNQIMAQGNFSCSQFCVTQVTIDTINSTWIFDIYFQGNGSDFINYPYVALALDNNGDTLAVGQMEYFGQFGNTTQSYHAAVVGASVGIEQIWFVYDQDTCQLTFPCQPVEVSEQRHEEWIVYENSLGWNWKGNGQVESIEIFDLTGSAVGLARGENTIINQNLSAGVYLYRLTTTTGVTTGHVMHSR